MVKKYKEYLIVLSVLLLSGCNTTDSTEDIVYCEIPNDSVERVLDFSKYKSFKGDFPKDELRLAILNERNEIAFYLNESSFTEENYRQNGYFKDAYKYSISEDKLYNLGKERLGDEYETSLEDYDISTGYLTEINGVGVFTEYVYTTNPEDWYYHVYYGDQKILEGSHAQILYPKFQIDNGKNYVWVHEISAVTLYVLEGTEYKELFKRSNPGGEMAFSNRYDATVVRGNSAAFMFGGRNYSRNLQVYKDNERNYEVEYPVIEGENKIYLHNYTLIDENRLLLIETLLGEGEVEGSNRQNRIRLLNEKQEVLDELLIPGAIQPFNLEVLDDDIIFFVGRGWLPHVITTFDNKIKVQEIDLEWHNEYEVLRTKSNEEYIVFNLDARTMHLYDKKTFINKYRLNGCVSK